MTTLRFSGIAILWFALTTIGNPNPALAQRSGQSPSRPTRGQPPAREHQVRVKIQAAEGASKFLMLSWTQAVRSAGAGSVSEVPGFALPKTKPDDPGGSGVRKTGAYEVEVFAVIGPGGNLHVAKDVFTLNAKARLAAFVRKLKAEGVPKPDPGAPMWGLSANQLGLLSLQLKRPFGREIKGKPLAIFIRELSSDTKIEIAMSSRLKPVASRISLSSITGGLSAGSAASYTLHNFGLAMEPRVLDSGRVGLLVMLSSESNRPWPVGLKPNGFPGKISPQLLRFVEYETMDMPLIDVIAAWEDLLEMEFVIDVPRLADMGMNMEKMKSSMVVKRSPLGTAMRRTLGPMGLKYELRVDEANKPFIWLTGTTPTGPKPK